VWPPGRGRPIIDAPVISSSRPSPALYRFLRKALTRLRWATLAALLLITMARPATGYLNLPAWLLILGFAAYSGLMYVLQSRLERLRSFRLLAILDLPVAGVLYLLANEAGGPLFILLFLALGSAAAIMSLRGSLLYTVATASTVAAIDTMLGYWSPHDGDVRKLATRVLMLVLVGAGTAILARRLSLEYEAAAESRNMTERLAERAELRAEFIATVSHDLRTPLTAVHAGLGMLKSSTDSRLRADEQDLLANVRRNVERLNVLIDDLLAFNQLESGIMHLDREPVDLRSIVLDSVSGVHPLIHEKGQTLELDLPEPLPVMGDARRLEQVMVNLLANGSRHTPAGTRILIHGRVQDGSVVLTVMDTGGGIPQDELDAIFQRFYRLRPGLIEGGSGLGLAIARALIVAHDGRIWAESDVGHSTTFHISLQRYQSAEDGAAVAAGPK